MIYSGQQDLCVLAALRDGGCGQRCLMLLLWTCWWGGFEMQGWAEIRSAASSCSTCGRVRAFPYSWWQTWSLRYSHRPTRLDVPLDSIIRYLWLHRRDRIFHLLSTGWVWCGWRCSILLLFYWRIWVSHRCASYELPLHVYCGLRDVWLDVVTKPISWSSLS